MKKVYICPAIESNIEVKVASFLDTSDPYKMYSAVDEDGASVLQTTTGQGDSHTWTGSSGQETIEAGARERGGDYGSLW